MSEIIVKIAWYCCHYVGSSKWKWSGDWVLEPDECCTDFETEDTKANWDDNCCTAICPNCGADLYQEDDGAELIEKRIEP
jgi:hypothetical protein